MTKTRLEAFSDGVIGIYWNNHHHPDVLYVAVALIWLAPDPRIEKRIASDS